LKNSPFSISRAAAAVVDRLEDADHPYAVPGELRRPQSIRPLDKPRGGGVKLGDAAVIYSMPLNGAGISAMASCSLRDLPQAVSCSVQEVRPSSRRQLLGYIDLG
jgi:hypothetical protein